MPDQVFFFLTLPTGWVQFTNENFKTATSHRSDESQMTALVLKILCYDCRRRHVNRIW
jgi:hypothetical protein